MYLQFVYLLLPHYFCFSWPCTKVSIARKRNLNLSNHLLGFMQKTQVPPKLELSQKIHKFFTIIYNVHLVYSSNCYLASTIQNRVYIDSVFLAAFNMDRQPDIANGLFNF